MANYDKSTGTSGTVRMVITYTQSAANNTTTFSVKFQIICTNSATYAYGKSWNGSTAGTSRSGKFDIDGSETVTVGTWTITKTHGSDGKLSAQSFSFTMGATGTSGLAGPTTVSTSITPPRIAKKPSQVTGLAATSTSPTSVDLSWTAPSGNGASLTGYDIQYATNSAFTGATLVSQGTAVTRRQTGLLPGTTYYFAVRAKSADGVGAWSSTVSQITLPASAPGMSVVSSPSGQSATVYLTSPGGVSGVTGWTIQYRVAGTTTATTLQRTAAQATSTVQGLTPGRRYEWRALAKFGTYETPWTAWEAVTQKNPSGAPGDYFDGATEATPDLTYSWTGTANNSTSRASGVAPLGWAPFTAGTSGTTGVVLRATGGVPITPEYTAGAHAVRVVFHSGSAGPPSPLGVAVGTSSDEGYRWDVTGGETYWGSIYLNSLNRSQRFELRLGWRDAAGAVLGEAAAGEAVVIPAGEWTRITVVGEAPEGAVTAILRATEVSGDGWVPWQGGDTLLADAAMLSLDSLYPYFDGDTPSGDGFEYHWSGSPNASTSSRSIVPASTDDPLQDPDCAVIPLPPRPPTVPSDCIEEVGVWRRYWATVPADLVPDWGTLLLTLQLTTDCNPHPVTGVCRGVRQVRIRVYPNPFGYTEDAFDTSSHCSELIVSYIPPNTTLTIDSVAKRAWADVGNTGSTTSADHLLYGTGGVPPTWPELSCGIPYLVSFDTDLETPADSVSVGVLVTQRA